MKTLIAVIVAFGTLWVVDTEFNAGRYSNVVANIFTSMFSK